MAVIGRMYEAKRTDLRTESSSTSNLNSSGGDPSPLVDSLCMTRKTRGIQGVYSVN